MLTSMPAFVKGFRMPVSHCARGCTEAGVRKASKEETAGEYAPAAVSVYGVIAQPSAPQFSSSHGVISALRSLGLRQHETLFRASEIAADIPWPHSTGPNGSSFG